MEAHEYANLFPMMTPAEYAALRDGMQANGYDNTSPIVTLNGRILDGRNRHKAAMELGIAPLLVEYEGSDPLGFVIRHNLNRRHLSESQRTIIAKELASMERGGDRPSPKDANFQSANLPIRNEVSQAEAAELLNVSERSIRTAKAVERDAPELISAIADGIITVNDANNIAKVEPEVRQEAVEMVQNGEAKTAKEAVEIIKKAFPHVAQNSGNNEWYTPKKFIESATAVMGRIDLDPASSAIANETVKAETFYTEGENGLIQKWGGKVWLNPPYAQPAISHFCDKLSAEWDAGNVDEAIVLVNNATETNWFATLADISTAICFPKGRIRFVDPDGNLGAPLQGQAIIYMGENINAFIKEFGQYGVTLWR